MLLQLGRGNTNYLSKLPVNLQWNPKAKRPQIVGEEGFLVN